MTTETTTDRTVHVALTPDDAQLVGASLYYVASGRDQETGETLRRLGDEVLGAIPVEAGAA